VNQHADAGVLAAARAAMAGRLGAAAGLDPQWREAFAAVPRDAFIPPLVWRDENGTGVPVDRASDPAAWNAMLYDEYASIVTQLDDGTDAGEGRFTSSSTMPVVMARMLAQMPVDQGSSVIEVGTGTGYNAAVLSHRYSLGRVSTIEVDPALATEAEKALERAGFGATSVLCGDGVDHLPADLHADALMATCSIAHLPDRWLRAVPNGIIIAPFYAGWLPAAVLVLHTRGGEGRGRFLRNFRFMHARAHRWEGPRPETAEAERERVTRLAPWLVTSANEAAAFCVSLKLPGVDYRIDERENRKTLTAWDNAAAQSWAEVAWERHGAGWSVREAGARSLWTDIEAAFEHWARLGEPSIDRYILEADTGDKRLQEVGASLVATLDGATVWLL
jgi:protein-L-isoaspartate O-methyltransferase